VGYRVDVYIGSDNGTRKISESYLRKVRAWADGVFTDGYTLVRGDGRYNGVSEESILINAVSERDFDQYDRLEKLKRELKQEAILLVKSSVDAKII
jgi:hypothetical protein